MESTSTWIVWLVWIKIYEIYSCESLFTCRYPVDQRTYLGYFMAYILQLIGAVSSILVVTSSVLIYDSLCIYAEAFFIDWNYYLLDIMPSGHNLLNKQISDLILYHSDILKYFFLFIKIRIDMNLHALTHFSLTRNIIEFTSGIIFFYLNGSTIIISMTVFSLEKVKKKNWNIYNLILSFTSRLFKILTRIFLRFSLSLVCLPLYWVWCAMLPQKLHLKQRIFLQLCGISTGTIIQ